MSGHSKWSTIKRQKGAADARRGAIFTKISNAITIAVRQGGGEDPSQNPRLRLSVEMARAANMPKDNIERAISRAKNRGEGELSEVIYEGFAQGGVSILVEAATDNVNRTTSEVKSLFSKNGANFGERGSSSYLFKQVGEITVSKNGKSGDNILLIAADCGAIDVEDRGEEVAIFTEISDLTKVKNNLSSKGFEVTAWELSRKPITTIKIPQDLKEKIISFLASLEAIPDVQKVYSNINP